MLSRVAENIYWMSRYIERAENTARLINVTTNLILDLPRSANVGWEYITEIMGSDELFHSLYDQPDERSILKFMIADMNNSGSIVSSLQMARENSRTIRDIIPRETWECINNLFIRARANTISGIARKNRHNYLSDIILGAQTITGQLAGTMYHDLGYDFLRMGRNLERADMTTRIIDVRSADLLENDHESLTPFENIQWMSVLKSLTGYQMYRRIVQVRIRRADVLKFLLQEKLFPRSYLHSVNEVRTCLQDLPRNGAPLDIAHSAEDFVMSADLNSLKQEQLHTFIDQLQLDLIRLHDAITETYFI